ncbi:hypothetical protein BCR43DRAFT_486727 [Syncephalastrum racemosum]|uniref:DNA polymerase kappa n=1 Tax=Syncephalastrum racemosum TaxID=13706 RepID=A0A1X2HQY7_SYNRA|nr:hypothetical protein BCR43DRAFT_486727 [Syncephalastrum racemosum]
MAECANDDDQIASQIIEEEDVFFDDADDLPVDHLLPAKESSLCSSEPSSSSASSLSSNDTLRKRLAGPSTNKAGMDSVDKERVNRIIYEASKGSAFFENERRRDEAVTKRIDAMLAKYNAIRDLDLSVESQVAEHMLHEMEESRDLTQHICHIDMDAFYASVEELSQPELKKVPMAVGSTSMLTTSNYEARKYGVRSAMPGYIALKLCPQLKIVRPHFDKYKSASKQVQAIFAKYDPNFAAMSLDEAYLNLTDYLSKTDMSPPALVEQIRQEIFEQTQLTASAGIAANKMLSKVCSDINKPNGQYYLPNTREAVVEFVKTLRIRKISGVGRVTERVLEALGVQTCGDIYARRAVLYRLLSPVSFKFLLRCHLGLGSTTVHHDTERKSISVERTFSSISEKRALLAKVDELAELLANDLDAKRVKGKTVGLKIKLTSFEVRVRAKTMPYYVYRASDLARIAKELLLKEMPVSLRLMGIKLSSLKDRTIDEDAVKKFFSVIPAKRPSSGDPSPPPESKQRVQQLEQQQKQGQNEDEEEELAAVECPICNRNLQLDNIAFNRHVDECLNRAAVRTILKKERTSTSPSPSPNDSSKSLLYYWKKDVT